MTKQERAKEVLEKILALMGIKAAVTEKTGEDGFILLTIESDLEDHPIIIGRYGTMLNSLQAIVAAVISNKEKAPVKVIIDIGDYRKRREESLRAIAISAAEEAMQLNRPVHLDPMSPMERRVIHTTFTHDDRIETHSDGTGEERHVVILPKDKSQGL